MARTIGVKNKNLVKSLTAEALKLGVRNVFDFVNDRLPCSVYEIWEGSSNEINRIINDTIGE